MELAGDPLVEGVPGEFLFFMQQGAEETRLPPPGRPGTKKAAVLLRLRPGFEVEG